MSSSGWRQPDDLAVVWIERLSTAHDRAEFTCGNADLDEWLRTKARQAQDRHESATTFVLTDDGTRILGFFSTSAHTVTVQQTPDELVRGFAAHLAVPALLLGRMAVAQERHGEGLGRRLLQTVVAHAIRAQEVMAVRLLVVDAIDDDAAAFYRRHGFVEWPSSTQRLFARVKDLRRALEQQP